MKTRSLAHEGTHPSVLMLSCAALLAACTAELGGGTSDGDTGAAGKDPADGTEKEVELPPYEAPTGMLRRLTRSQFANAVLDVFGTEVDVKLIEQDSYEGSFAAIGASSVVTSELGVERYHSTIEAAVDAVFADSVRRDEFVGCTPLAADDACMQGFLTTTGRRAFRRDLTAEEVSQLVSVAAVATTELEDVWEGARWATVALFTSPHFLYRPELGTATAEDTLQLSGYEIASRLAFLLWNSLPDQALLDDALSGALDTREGRLAAAERMLSAPEGHQSVGAFAEDYMRLDRVLTQAKDPSLFPEYSPTLQKAMVEDMRRVWESVAFFEDQSALDLFSTRKAFVNSELAGVYGLDPAGLDESTYQEVTLPEESPRIGILGKMAFLSQFANQKEGSPTLRGKFMREALMCTEVPLPPGDVALELPEPPPDKPMTKRERLEQHRTDPTCANCHAMTDPMGLPFENFDAIGRYRTTDHGLPIDSSGDFEGTPVAHSRELGEVMSSSAVVADCLTRKFYTYAVGHTERKVDAVVIQELNSSFEASGYRLKQLILDIIASDAFVAVAPQEP